MKPAGKLVREQVVTELLRGISGILGEEPPTLRELRIIAAVKSLRDEAVTRVLVERVDYLEMVQKASHRAWWAAHGHATIITGPEHDAIAGVDTPLGRLKAITYRRQWKTGRTAWVTEYYLEDQPITIRDIRAAGLAQRPTMRNRQRREP